jgi:SsrA-binding protein
MAETKLIAENRRARRDFEFLERLEAAIAEYPQSGAFGHEPERERKLLLHRSEIDSLYGKVRERGLTLVPIRMYFKDGRVKVELALARGRERADKRRVIAERDAQRQMERALKRRR